MSLHSLLTRLIWLCVGPLVLLAVFLAIHSVMADQADLDIEAANLAKNFTTAIDQHLNARISALHMLTESPLLDDPSRWKDLYREAQGFNQGFGSHVILADLEMHMLFNTRVPYGTKLPMLPQPKGHAAAPASVETGKPAVGDTFFGPLAREPLVAIAVPAQRNGKTAFLLLTIFETKQFQAHLAKVALPSGWSLTLLDGKHEVIATRMSLGLNPIADVDASGRFVFQSAVSPWSVMLEIPRNIYHRRLLATAVILIIAIMCVTLVSILGGIMASRRLGRSVASLAETPAPGAPPPDITEIATVRSLLDESTQKRETAEAAGRESERRFRATFEQAAVGIALVAPDGRWLRVNQKLCDIVGYSHDELLTRTFQEITHPDDLDADLARLKQMLANEIKTYSIEKRYIRKDGDIVWINLTTSLVWKTDATPYYFISVIEDIQARKQAEDALQESEARYRTLFDDAKDGIALAETENGRLVDCNQSLCKMVERDKEELLGQAQSILHPPEEVIERFSQTFKRHLTGDPGLTLEACLLTKSGDLTPVEIRASSVRINDRDFLMGVFRDITERKQAEEHLKETLESLRKAVGTTIQVMVSAVETRDPYTSGHQTRSAALASAIAIEMGLPQEKIDGILLASSIHDIGKLSIPAEILSKPTKLSAIEMSLIREHASRGYEILKYVESSWPLAEIVHQHHERMDGSGYPRNLKGEEILIEARILAVADVVEAMASHRPYRPGLGIDVALNEIEQNSGIFYDNTAADACLRLFREKGYQLPGT